MAAATVVASRTDNENVYYYTSLHEAVAAVPAVAVEAGGSANLRFDDLPDEITLLADIVLDEPLIINDYTHIRLVVGNTDTTIYRGGSLIEFPLIWVSGENASLTLGKPGMEYELVIDGGYLNEPPIEAHAPLIAVNGPDSKLIMYGNVTLANNYNNGNPMSVSHYQNGAGVFIRTYHEVSGTGGGMAGRQAEFIMKGGTIRGNTNNAQSYLAHGGGVFIADFGIFTMEGGVIMNNTAHINGGGLFTMGYGSFRKTGGIIYGADAPMDLRNNAIEGIGTPLCYGHSVAVAMTHETISRYRNDTVTENDNLTFTGTSKGHGSFGEGEKWDYPHKSFERRLIFEIITVIVFAIIILWIVTRIILKKRLALLRNAKKLPEENASPEIDFDSLNITSREKEIFTLLLTKLSIKEIAHSLKITNAGVNFHAANLYQKLGIQNRRELFVRFGK